MSAEQALESCEYFANDRVTLYEGDCIEVMRGLPENSVDAVVTDPPYGLEFMGKDWDAPWKANGDVLTDPASVGGFQDGAGGNPYSRSRIRYGRDGNAMVGFQDWFTDVATEALRVLKPGGHLLAFGGTRTWHRLASAIEDAGFEVRDSIAWMYGSGFPKSHDVSKGIDKQRHDRAEVLEVTAWMRSARDKAGKSNREIDQKFGFAGMAGHWTSSASQPTVPTLDQIPTILDLFDLSLDDLPDRIRDLIWTLNGNKGQPGPNWAAREVTGQHSTPAAAQQWMSNYGEKADLTAKERKDKPATPAAEQWAGWGTALKPAHEPIVVARKPLMGTVAENVLTHGTGALNIDGCRIQASDAQEGRKRHGGGIPGNGSSFELPDSDHASPAGRWPANVILDESQAAALDKQSDDTSRFFYCPKAGKKERPNVDGVAHPTVKPLALMRYLCKLVTPPGGTILEPFSGSGTTIEAALLEGFNVIGIEMTEEYLPLIMSRIERYDEGMF